MTPNWPWTLNRDKYSVCMKDLPLRLKSWSVSLYDDWFSRYKIHLQTETEQLLVCESHFTYAKSTLHTLNTPEAQILVSFALRLTISEIHGSQKSEMYWMTPNWTWTLNSQKYSIYT